MLAEKDRVLLRRATAALNLNSGQVRNSHLLARTYLVCPFILAQLWPRQWGVQCRCAQRRPHMFVVVYVVVVYDKLPAHTWRHSHCAELWKTYSPLLQLLWQTMLNFVCSWPMQFQQKTLLHLSTLLKIVFLQRMLTTIC